MIQKFVDLVNETVDESFAKGIELFLENLNDELVLTHRITNEGLDAVLEQACSVSEEGGEPSNDEIDNLTAEEIAEAMEALGIDEEDLDDLEE